MVTRKDLLGYRIDEAVARARGGGGGLLRTQGSLPRSPHTPGDADGDLTPRFGASLGNGF